MAKLSAQQSPGNFEAAATKSGHTPALGRPAATVNSGGFETDSSCSSGCSLARSLSAVAAGARELRDLELDSLCNIIAIITNPLAVVRSTHIHIRHAVVFRHTLAPRRGRRVRVQLRLKLLLVALAYRPRRGGKFQSRPASSIDTAASPRSLSLSDETVMRCPKASTTAQRVHLCNSRRCPWTRQWRNSSAHSPLLDRLVRSIQASDVPLWPTVGLSPNQAEQLASTQISKGGRRAAADTS